MTKFQIALLSLFFANAITYGVRVFSKLQDHEKPRILQTATGLWIYNACMLISLVSSVWLIYWIVTQLGWLNLLILAFVGALIWILFEIIMVRLVGNDFEAAAPTLIVLSGSIGFAIVNLIIYQQF